MRPTSTFFIIQLSNSRIGKKNKFYTSPAGRMRVIMMQDMNKIFKSYL